MQFTMDSVDLGIVVFYLIAILLIGLWAGSGTKDLKDYAIAGKIYGVPMLLMTIMATNVDSTSLMGVSSKIYKHGIIHLMVFLGGITGYALGAIWIFPKFDKRFDGMISACDIVKKYYSGAAEKVAAVVAFFRSIGEVGIQMIAIGEVTSVLCGIPYIWGVIFGGGVAVVYSSIGGIKAVTVTDAIQFILLISVLPIIASISLYNISFGDVVQKMPDTHFQITGHSEFLPYCYRFAYLSLLLFLFSPSMVQRYLMAQDKRQLSKVFFYRIIAKSFTIVMILCMTFGVMVQFSGEIQENRIPLIAINNLLPIGLKGIAVVAVLSIVMSTIDSELNTGGITLVHNFIRAFFRGGKIPNELRLVKVCALFTGVLAVIFATGRSDIFETGALVGASWSVTMGVPIMLVVLGLRTFNGMFWVNLLTCFCTVVFNKYALGMHVFGKDMFLTIFAASVLGIFTCLVSIAIYNKGEMWDDSVFDEDHDERDRVTRPVRWAENLRRYSPSNFLNTLRKSLSSSRDDSLMVASFICIMYAVPFFMWDYKNPSLYPEVIVFRWISAAMASVIFFKSYWPASIKKYFALYWYTTLFFSLSFTSAYMMVNEFHNHFWMTNAAFCIMILAMVVDWSMFVGFTVVGGILALLVSNMRYSLISSASTDVYTDFDTMYYTFYVLAMSIIIGVVFARGRQKEMAARIEEQDFFSSSMAHEAQSPTANMSMSILSLIDVIKRHERNEGNDVVIRISKNHADYYRNRVKDCSALATNAPQELRCTLLSTMKDVPQSVKYAFSVRELIEESLSDLPFGDHHKCRFLFQGGEDFLVFTARPFLKNVFYNIYRNAISHAFEEGKDQFMAVRIEGHKVYFADNGRGISPANLPHIFERFYTASESGTGIGLSFCDHVMHDLGGYIECKSWEGIGTEFILSFPEIDKKLLQKKKEDSIVQPPMMRKVV